MLRTDQCELVTKLIVFSTCFVRLSESMVGKLSRLYEETYIVYCLPKTWYTHKVQEINHANDSDPCWVFSARVGFSFHAKLLGLVLVYGVPWAVKLGGASQYLFCFPTGKIGELNLDWSHFEQPSYLSTRVGKGSGQENPQKKKQKNKTKLILHCKQGPPMVASLLLGAVFSDVSISVQDTRDGWEIW